MNRKLIIERYEGQIITVLFENEEAVELHCSENETILGNIYVGKVKNIVNNIHAAFIEIADGMECYYAIEENSSPIFTHKVGKKPLCIGDELLVQVSKEAVKTKVPTVSSNLNFTGKYAVLTTGDTRIGVSAKVAKGQKERLQQLVMPYANEKYGFIMRTNAQDADDDVLKQEIEGLIDEYESLMSKANTRVCFSCLKSVPKSYLTELRNMYQDGTVEILVEDKLLYEEVKAYLETEQSEDLEKLRLYDDKLLPLHKLYSLEKHITHALKQYVWLKSGAYLVIQPTEALTVIDVNTGKCISKKKDEAAYLKINLEAAKEAAKQIRLRNLSGIILVDFINLAKPEDMETLLDYFNKELHKDRIATTLVDVTKLQLVEITRKKVRKPFHEAFSQKKIVNHEEMGIQ